jgi:hypothetical protein
MKAILKLEKPMSAKLTKIKICFKRNIKEEIKNILK